MTKRKTPNDADDALSVRDTQIFLDEEIIAVTKATDLRIRELTQTVTSYATGQITPEQVVDRLWRYHEKWGEALPGVPNNDELLTLAEMRAYVKDEITNLARATNMRIRELVEIVFAYAVGEITPKEASDRQHAYHVKWGEALPGVRVAEGASDKDITATVERTADQAAVGRRERLYKHRGGEPGASR